MTTNSGSISDAIHQLCGRLDINVSQMAAELGIDVGELHDVILAPKVIPRQAFLDRWYEVFGFDLLVATVCLTLPIDAQHRGLRNATARLVATWDQQLEEAIHRFRDNRERSA